MDELFFGKLSKIWLIRMCILAAPLPLIWFIFLRKYQDIDLRPNRVIARTSNRQQIARYDLMKQMKKLPRVTGFLYDLMLRIQRSIIGHVYLISNMRRQVNVDLMKRLELNDAPTFYPFINPFEVTKDKLFDVARLQQYLDEHEQSSTDKNTFTYNSILDYAAAYRKGYTTPLQVTKNAIKAIKASDALEPKLRAFLECNANLALEAAAESTERFKQGQPLSVVDGILVGVKALYKAKSLLNTDGSLIYANNIATEDAYIVRKLRECGAIIIGITNMSEFGILPLGANANSVHGAARNPYNLDYETGGSSSGSSAAVAAGLCLVGLGTDGGGSVRIPASCCGTVGLKPTFGRLSRSGIGSAETVGHCGFTCVSAIDTAIVYAILGGPDVDDPLTYSQPAVNIDNLKKIDDLSGLRIGIYREYFEDADPELVRCCYDAVEKLKSLGATIVDIVIPELEDARVAHVVTITSEIASCKEILIEQNIDIVNKNTLLPYYAGKTHSAIEYVKAQKVRTRHMKFAQEIFTKVDCVVTPTLGITTPKIPTTAGDRDIDSGMLADLMKFIFLGNLIGIPGISVPVGYGDKNLPIGLQIMTYWWNEALALRIANAVEKMCEKKKPKVYYDIMAE